MILDNERQREILTELIMISSFPGKHAEEVVDLIRAIREAKIKGKSRT